MQKEKIQVRVFWNDVSCGENLYLVGENLKGRFLNQSKERYRLEPELLDYAEFDKHNHKKVFKIGVGLGSDHQILAEAGAVLPGIDLTPMTLDHIKHRFELFDLQSSLKVEDAKNLPFDHEAFEVVYLWGVIHHSLNTEKAINEVYRVLNLEGFAKIIIQHKYSMVRFMLWLKYAFFGFRCFVYLDSIYNN